MGYSSTAINSAMSKKLLFNTTNSLNESNNTLKIAAFSQKGFYKVSLSSTTGKMYLSCEITNNRIISAQSVYKDFRKYYYIDKISDSKTSVSVTVKRLFFKFSEYRRLYSWRPYSY